MFNLLLLLTTVSAECLFLVSPLSNGLDCLWLTALLIVFIATNFALFIIWVINRRSYKRQYEWRLLDLWLLLRLRQRCFECNGTKEKWKHNQPGPCSMCGDGSVGRNIRLSIPWWLIK